MKIKTYFEKEEVNDFIIDEDRIYLNIQSEKRLQCFNLITKEIIFDLSANIYKFYFWSNYLFVQEKQKSYVSVYNRLGNLIYEIDRFPDLTNSFRHKNKLVIPTSDRLENKKRYYTEINLDTFSSVEWEWDASVENYSYFIPKIMVNQYFIGVRWIIRDKKGLIEKIDKIDCSTIWSIKVEDLLFSFDWISSTNIIFYKNTNDEIIVFSIYKWIFCLDSVTGTVRWKIKSETQQDIKYFLFVKGDVGHILTTSGDFSTINLLTGKIVEKILFLENTSSLPNFSDLFVHWKRFVKIKKDLIYINYPFGNIAGIYGLDIEAVFIKDMYSYFKPKEHEIFGKYDFHDKLLVTIVAKDMNTERPEGISAKGYPMLRIHKITTQNI